QRFGAMQDLTTQGGKGDIAPPCHQIISQLHDLLLFRFIRDFRSTQHHDHFGSHAFEQGDYLGGFFHIPDVHAETDNTWLMNEQTDRKSTRLNSSHVKISYAVF